MEDQVIIQRKFTITDPDTGTPFTDALVMPQAQYDALSEADIQSLKQKRFDDWKTLLSTPSPIEPTPVVDQISALDDQIDGLTQQKEALQTQLDGTVA